MSVKQWVGSAVTTFAVTLAVAAIVTYLWSLIADGAGAVDWETAFRFAVILGVILPWVTARERRAKKL